jgi:hypothetical protein
MTAAAPVDTGHLAPELRQRMTAAYRRILPIAKRGCWQGSECLMWGVPKWVVRAYVLAVFTGRNPAEACIDACLGAGAWASLADNPDWAGRALGEAYAARLSACDREALALGATP